MKLPSAQVRQWGYTVVTAGLALLVFYKIISPEALPYWLTLVAALFAMSATATAAMAVSQQRKDGTLN